jgi:hypothetical protein
METTFIIRENELNDDFLSALKKLFKYKSQLQITVTASEDFNLMKPESPDQYIARLEKCLAEIKKPEFRISITDEQLDEMIFEKI